MLEVEEMVLRVGLRNSPLGIAYIGDANQLSSVQPDKKGWVDQSDPDVKTHIHESLRWNKAVQADRRGMIGGNHRAEDGDPLGRMLEISAVGLDGARRKGRADVEWAVARWKELVRKVPDSMRIKY